MWAEPALLEGCLGQRPPHQHQQRLGKPLNPEEEKGCQWGGQSGVLPLLELQPLWESSSPQGMEQEQEPWSRSSSV